ncbi:MAG: CRISPR system precrRNA processing endoribonuclease RAMP protein Cas6 [Epsilonproteobacteria bacterium]|nr:CRISPR system precrRNA processing endoribonuclease RAMP protein Cas6 [Campylobacterota bacterium]
MRFVDLQRYSTRQRTKMRIGGVVGEMVLEGVDERAYRLFRVAEILGVGKLGTFGLGKIKVEDLG